MSLQVRPVDSSAGLRRLWAPARTGRNRQYSHFRRNLSAPVDLLLRRDSTGCSWCVTISRRYQDVTNSTRVFNMLNICLRRTLVATDAASGRTDTSTTVYSRKHDRANSIEGALYNHAPHIANTANVPSTKPRRLGGRAQFCCDYAQATALIMGEQPRCTTSMLRGGCAELTPFRQAQGKLRRDVAQL